ncbi:hypothetical protein [Frankia sp. ArI3]|nr:hypothetical protein [Frankia sp. ArI3]
MRGLLGDGRGRAEVLSHFVAGLTADDEATLLALLAAAEDDEPSTGGGSVPVAGELPGSRP